MKSRTCKCRPLTAGMVFRPLIAVFLLFTAIGCQNETATSPDYMTATEEDQEIIHATVFVDAAVGSDDYDGSSLTYRGNGIGPKKTIQAGLDITPIYRTCYVAPGIYSEQIRMPGGVTLAGAGAEATIIDGGNQRGNIVTILDCNGAPTVVRGFTIRNGSCYGDNAGIRIQNSSNVVIRNNVITANRADGIRVYSASARILNNTIAGNGRNGIMAHGTASLEAVNNIIADNVFMWPAGCEFGWGLYCTDWAVISSSHNDVWGNNNNYWAETEGNCSPGAGDLSADPIFVDPLNDFHLREGSPCIDAGIYVGLKYHGEAPDMGAFEYRK